MPPVSKIALLPEEIRDELDKRLKDHQFGRITETSEWLRDQGYEVGKSTVGAYSLELKRDVQNAERLREARVLRLECLRVAAFTGPADNVLGRAQEYLNWVQGKQA